MPDDKQVPTAAPELPAELPPELEWLAMNLLVVKPSALQLGLFLLGSKYTVDSLAPAGAHHEEAKNTLMRTVRIDEGFATRILSNEYYRKLIVATIANRKVLEELREKLFIATGAYDPGSSPHPGEYLSQEVLARLTKQSVREPLGTDFPIL